MTQMITHSLVASAALLLPLVVAPYAEAQQPGAHPKRHHTPQRDKDVKLNQAKEAYARRVAEVEQLVAQITEEALRKARLKARNVREKRLRTAREALLAAYDSAIQRAMKTEDPELASRLRVEKQSIKCHGQPVDGHGICAPGVDPGQFRDREFYKCVLGTYGRYAREARYPVANLSIPNRDLWSEAIQSRLRGSIDFFKLNYKGDAKLIIPEDGVYTLEMPGRGTGFELDGKTLKRGDVELRKGVYSVQITTGTHGQPYLPDSFVRILHKGTNEELPLVNTGADIKKFLSSTIDHHAVVEVSGYRPEVVDPALLSEPRSRQEE